MQEQDAQELLKKYLAGRCTEDEKALLETWYIRQKGEGLPEISDETENQAMAEVWSRLPIPQNQKTIRLWPRIAAAAAILIFAGGGYLLLHHPQQAQTYTIVKNDVAPGGTKAILTLNNGQQITLDDKKNGQIAVQAGKSVNVGKNGTVIYANNIKGNGQTAALVYNTLTIPIGNHRDIALSDGTEVSLDAGSSITYPVVFDKKGRTVSITGQAYFKVKHHTAWPFNVKVKDLIIHDIGTEFNINAYDDEPEIKTTLISGSIKVNKGNQTMVLKPNEQAITTLTAPSIKIVQVDTEPVIAWKNGDFIFQDEDFKTAMRQVARWYNVDITYDPSATIKIVPGGWISRSKNISAVLNIMELTGKVHFKVEGRRVTVMK